MDWLIYCFDLRFSFCLIVCLFFSKFLIGITVQIEITGYNFTYLGTTRFILSCPKVQQCKVYWWKKIVSQPSLERKPPPITKTRLFKYIANFTSKNRKFSDKKNSDIFRISAQNVDCGYLIAPPRRGGSNKYPRSMFLSRNKENNVYPSKPQFYYIKAGFKGIKII